MTAPEDPSNESEDGAPDAPARQTEEHPKVEGGDSSTERRAAQASATTELDLSHSGQVNSARPATSSLSPMVTEPDADGASHSDPPPTVRGKKKQSGQGEAGRAHGQVVIRQATLTSADDEERAQTPGVDAYVGYIIDGRYHIQKQLAQGGMGVVYQARHRLIDKTVAIKILRPELVHDREITQRFLTEAQAASAIGSEHIVDITDYGELPDGATYIVMEYLEGLSLARRIRADEPVSIEDALGIARQLAEGLAAAHAAQIIHRDLKPDNVLLVDRGKEHDFVKILDFGIAKVASSQNQITRAGKIFGTPHYMSPEQAKGEELDRRTDIYSFGVILYEMVAQRLPFEAENPLGVLTQHMYVDAKPLHEVCEREIPVGLEAITAKCLSKNPDDRYSSMLELEEELARVAEGFEPLAVEELRKRSRIPESLRSRFSGPSKESGLRGIVVGAVAALTLAAASWWSTNPLSDVTIDTAQKPVSSAPSASNTAEPGDENGTVVALVLSPVDARVFRGNNDLGPMPLNVQLRKGQKLELEVRRAGYKTQSVVVDGTERTKVVQLQPIPGAQRGAVPTALVDPGAIRTISFGADAGTFVSRVTPAADGNSWDSDAGARPANTPRSSGLPSPVVPDLGEDERPAPPRKPPGPPPVSASSDKEAPSPNGSGT